MSCLGVILQVRGRDGMSTPQNGVAAYSQSHVSRICHSGFLLPSLRFLANVRAPYSDSSNFRQYFYGIRYTPVLGHPLTSTENFTEIVQGKPLRRGS